MRRRRYGADFLHEFANLIIGFQIPRRWIRALSPRKREKLWAYMTHVWYDANDNYIPPRDRVKRPRWLPKKYIYGP